MIALRAPLAQALRQHDLLWFPCGSDLNNVLSAAERIKKERPESTAEMDAVAMHVNAIWEKQQHIGNMRGAACPVDGRV